MEPDLLQTAQLRQSMYLAFEVVKLACPAAASRFEARFRGLLAYYHHPDRPGHAEVRGPEPEYSGLALTLRDGQPSGRFIPLVVDALFHDFLGLHQHGNPLEIKQRFCEDGLPRFLKKNFPNLDLRRAEYRRLQKICRDLRTEAADLSATGVPEALTFETAYPGGPLLESRSPAWRDLLQTAIPAARSKAPILLTGETGSGKEVAALFIHRQSPRAGGPFVAVNCGAVPENLLESELFGYRKGAFTEAKENKPGLFTQAHGGTLFLDEIGEMPPRLQVKLLRFLQDHSVLALGAVRPVKVDVRIVAATNLDIDEARARGAFRQDLYYRLNVFQFALPPLRERREDIPALAERFTGKYNIENQTQVKGLTKSAVKILQKYPWPGNIRELENVIQRAVILAGRGRIKPAHLPPELSKFGAGPESGPKTKTVLEEEALFETVAKALARPPDSRGQARRLGESVPLAHLVRFFQETDGRPFAPREFADFISPPGQAARRDKLAHKILKALETTGLLKHNGRPAQAARYSLNPGPDRPGIRGRR